ncbi:MAG: zinc ribbon domain-containing protein [Phycisphaerales bacterium]
MPLYEYVCETDGSRIELIRPMRDADAPVEDPDGKGRRFTRALSMPMLRNADSGASTATAPSGGMCGCGKSHGGCGRG